VIVAVPEASSVAVPIGEPPSENVTVPVGVPAPGEGCAVLVEAAEVIVWSNDRRRARLRPDPYAGLADDELSPLRSGGRGRS
jgi:hypothetical protein